MTEQGDSNVPPEQEPEQWRGWGEATKRGYRIELAGCKRADAERRSRETEAELLARLEAHKRCDERWWAELKRRADAERSEREDP